MVRDRGEIESSKKILERKKARWKTGRESGSERDTWQQGSKRFPSGHSPYRSHGGRMCQTCMLFVVASLKSPSTTANPSSHVDSRYHLRQVRPDWQSTGTAAAAVVVRTKGATGLLVNMSLLGTLLPKIC